MAVALRHATDMTVVSSTASSKHSNVWEAVHQFTVKIAELLRISGIKVFGVVQFLVAHP